MVSFARWARLVVTPAVVALLVSASACTVTPVPEPPNLEPPDLAQITFGTSSSTGLVTLMGNPGALGPGERLWVVNLDGAGPPIETDAAADGSFSVGVSASFGHELRLQAREGDRRSDPLDVAAPAAVQIVRPLADCLTINPPFEVAFGASPTGTPVDATLHLDNACGATVEIASMRLRVERTDFVIADALPLSVSDGGSADVALRFVPESAGLSEEILFLDLIAPESSRLPFTLWGTSPE